MYSASASTISSFFHKGKLTDDMTPTGEVAGEVTGEVELLVKEVRGEIKSENLSF